MSTQEQEVVEKVGTVFNAAFLASQVLIPPIPRLLGPGLNKAGKFPTLIGHTYVVENKVNDIRRNVKFQMRKVFYKKTWLVASFIMA